MTAVLQIDLAVPRDIYDSMVSTGQMNGVKLDLCFSLCIKEECIEVFLVGQGQKCIHSLTCWSNQILLSL